MMGDLWPSGGPVIIPLCARCKLPTASADGPCGHQICGVCGRCPPCDGPLPVDLPEIARNIMSAFDDRRRWLDHLHECTRCPTDPCDTGLELAAAVRGSMAPGESWEGVYRAGEVDFSDVPHDAG